MAHPPPCATGNPGPSPAAGRLRRLPTAGHHDGRAGHTYPAAGIIDAVTAPGPRRAVGEVIATSTIPGVGQLTGFENHLGQTTLGPDLTPLGHLQRGTGNGTPHHGATADGVLTTTLVGTYLHGPVLARNPALADHLLTLATGLRLTPLELPDQDVVRRTYLHPAHRRGPGPLDPSSSP